MRDVLQLVVPVFALALDKVLHYLERKRWEKERQRLMLAALAPTPAAAHASLMERKPSEPREPQPKPIGI